MSLASADFRSLWLLKATVFKHGCLICIVTFEACLCLGSLGNGCRVTFVITEPKEPRKEMLMYNDMLTGKPFNFVKVNKPLDRYFGSTYVWQKID